MGKEKIEQLCMCISAWMNIRGECTIKNNHPGFIHADQMVGKWVDELIKEIQGEWKPKENDKWNE